jgi:hypothetical protein
MEELKRINEAENKLENRMKLHSAKRMLRLILSQWII